MNASDFPYSHPALAPLSDADLSQIAAWLDGQLDERRSAHVEALLAADAELLTRVLALRELHSEPVAAAELLQAQALVAARAVGPSLLQRCVHAFALLLQPQRAPVAVGAVMTVAMIAGSLWFGTLASQEFGGDELQSVSMLEVTRLDFAAIDSSGAE